MWWSVTLEFLIKIFIWCYISLVFPLLITSVTTLFLSVINKHLSCCACYMFPWPQNSLCPYLHSWSFVNPLKLKVMCYHFQVFPFYFMIPVYIQIMSLLVPVFNESIQFIIKHFVVDGALYIPVKLKDMWADSILFFPARKRQCDTSCIHRVSPGLHPSLHAVQRSPSCPPASRFPSRLLLYPLHDPLCLQ